MSNATPPASVDLFSTVPCNSNWQWTVDLLAIRLGAPQSTVSQSCSEQLKTPSLLAGGVAFVPFYTNNCTHDTRQLCYCTLLTVPKKSVEGGDTALGMGTIDFMKSRQLSRQLLAKKIGRVNGQGNFFFKKFLKSIIRSTIWPNKWPSQLSSQSYDQKKISSQLSSQLCDQFFFSSQLSSQLFSLKNIIFFYDCDFLVDFGWLL